MAHELEQMFSVHQTPWHKLGRVINGAPTIEEGIKLAGLNWDVISQPLYRDASSLLASGLVDLQPVTSHKALVRTDSGKQLSVVGKDYTPLQNIEAFNFFNPFLEGGQASLETAGSLREGKNIWVLAKLNRAPIEVVKGDVVQKFLLLSNGHDGMMAVRVGFTPIRVVCANTLAMSHDNSKSSLIRVFHGKQVKANVDKIQDIVNAADAKFEATAEQYKQLARANVNKKDIEKYVEIVFKYSAVEDERRAISKQNRIADITRLFEEGRGNSMAGVRGTAWALYNATTEYLSYEAGRGEDSRLNSLWFGSNNVLNKSALKAAMEFAVA